MTKDQIQYAVYGEASNYASGDWDDSRSEHLCYEAFKAGADFMQDLMEAEMKERFHNKDAYIQELESRINKESND